MTKSKLGDLVCVTYAQRRIWSKLQVDYDTSCLLP